MTPSAFAACATETAPPQRPGLGAPRPVLRACAACGGRRMHFTFTFRGLRVVRCVECGLLFLNPQPSDAELAEIYAPPDDLAPDVPEVRGRVTEMKARAARQGLTLIGRYRGGHGGRLLDVGCGRGELLAEARRLGYEVTGILGHTGTDADAVRKRLGAGAAVHPGDVGGVPLEPGTFDVCTLTDVLEHVRDPYALLRAVHRLLKPEGVLFVATPSLDSWPARWLRQNWTEFRPEHLTYFDMNTARRALYRAGFHQVLVQPGWTVLNLDGVSRHLARGPVPRPPFLVRALSRVAPRRLRARDPSVGASGIGVLARATTPNRRPKVSVIVPAYDEAPTFGELMEALLRKEVPGCDLEVVVVESNSRDGTREIARRYQDHPRVTVVLEDRPRGKGHAVRTGFRHATGNFILIQDADLEYDLEDYDALLEPLLRGRVNFVLGARHGGGAWKMRRFVGRRWLSGILNFGHWFFTTLVNVFFRQRLRDPFTMFKVFRRDCLYGLTFSRNRFDFDYELLVKLVRKGYRPLEVPVNYRSRSFQEGKKVSFLRDPLTWLWAVLRLRFERIDPLREVERQHQARGQRSED